MQFREITFRPVRPIRSGPLTIRTVGLHGRDPDRPDRLELEAEGTWEQDIHALHHEPTVLEEAGTSIAKRLASIGLVPAGSMSMMIFDATGRPRNTWRVKDQTEDRMVIASPVPPSWAAFIEDLSAHRTMALHARRDLRIQRT